MGSVSLLLQRLLVPLLLFGALVASNSRTDFDRDREFIRNGAGDIISYVSIAEAAPGFPAERMPFHHAQRWPLPYALGLLHHATGVPVYALFRGATLAMQLAILILLTLAFSDLKLTLAQSDLLSAVLILNPYAFRYYLTLPGMINDVGFALGLTVLSLGMLRRQAVLVLLGIALAALSRQTAILLAPAAVLGWFAIEKPLRRQAWVWILAFLAPLLIYGLTSFVARRFGAPSVNLSTMTGLFSWLRTQFSWIALIEFLVRWSIPFWASGALLLASVFAHRIRFPARQAIGLLALWALVQVQPLLGGPEVTGQSVARLGVLGLVPWVLCLGVFFREHRLFEKPGRDSLALGALLAVGSIHHTYAYNGSLSSEKAGSFALLQAAVALLIGILAYRGILSEARANSRAPLC